MNGDGVRITDWDGEVPKHRKKAKKRTPKKFDHKHDYEHIIGRWTRQGHNYKTGQPQMYIIHSLITRCTICGNLGEIPWRQRKEQYPDADYFGQQLELPQKYPKLPVVDIPARW